MKILKIGLKNLNSLKLETVLDFTEIPLRDAGLFAIVGDTGAGKTTILDALTLGLYGKVHRNDSQDEVLSYGTVEGYAEVEFLVKGNIYRAKWMIWRARKKVDGNINKKRELSEWNEKKAVFEVITTKIREVDEQLEHITGLDYNRFCKSVLLSQGDFAAFLKADDKKRSELLERITGTNVYSEISIAAHERHKLESEKIAHLQTELDRLDILDEETLTTLHDTQKALAKTSKQQRKELQTIQRQIDWQNSITSLKNQVTIGAQAVEQAASEIAAAQTKFNKLEKHQKTLVFQKELTQLEGLEMSLVQLEQEKIELSKAIANYQLEKERYAQLSEAEKQKLKTHKADKTKQEKVFKKVDILDVTIAEKQAPFEKIQVEKKNIDTEIAEHQKLITEQKAAKTAKEELLEKIKDWLKEQANYKNISPVLSKLETQMGDWAVFATEQQTWKKRLEANAVQLTKAKNAISNLEQQIAAQKAALLTTQKQLAVLVPHKKFDRHELLNQLDEEANRLDKQTQTLKRLIDLNEDYLEKVQQGSHYEYEIQDLESKIFMIESRLLSALEMEVHLVEQRDFKKQLYDREKLLANYEKDRANLVEGEQCPLCFSTSHPFHQMKDYKNYVHRTEAEYEVAESRLDIVQKEIQKLLFRQKEISQLIEQLNGQKEGYLEGKREYLLHKIRSAEFRIAEIAPELLDKNLYHIRNSGLLKAQLEITKKTLEEKKQQKKTLLGLDQKMTKQEEEITVLQQALNEEKLKAVNYESSQNNLSENLTTILNKQQQLAVKIDVHLKPFNFSMTENDVTTILEALTKKSTDYEKCVQKQIEEQNALALLNQQVQQLDKEAKKLQKTQSKVEEQFQQLQSQLSDLKKERLELFGEQSVEVVKRQLEQGLQALEENVNTLEQQLKEAEIALKSEGAKAQKNEKDIEQNKKALDALHTDLLVKIQSKGFESLVVLKAANLPETEVTVLNALKNKLEKQQTEKQQTLKNSKEALQQVLAQTLTTDTLETLVDKQQEIGTQLEDIQQQIGKITQQLEENDRRKQVGKELIEKMDGQKKEHNRWTKLKELIGSADGKLFRAFAQGLTLKKLSDLANRHLEQLNGRYLIHKPNDRDLTLEIIDQHHANNIRSIHTLSGGESFLVSLALALGLSDLAGRNTQINSLFIDEGFGTLDESALDLAITTLENLQSNGKRIGVISHVATLKERITTQIQVQKQGSGFSKLEVL